MSALHEYVRDLFAGVPGRDAGEPAVNSRSTPDAACNVFIPSSSHNVNNNSQHAHPMRDTHLEHVQREETDVRQADRGESTAGGAHSGPLEAKHMSAISGATRRQRQQQAK